MPAVDFKKQVAVSDFLGPSISTRLIQDTEIRMSEIISSLSVALDITQGHPQGHCMRTAMIGMRLADELQLSTEDSSALFYALLLKDLGCSSNAAKMAYLFGADDQTIKHSARLIDWTKPAECLKHCWNNCCPTGSPLEKILKILAIMRQGPEAGRKIAEIRCDRGAEIAGMLRMPEATARAIRELDENWNGRGNPYGLKREEISVLGRICCLAQSVEVFFSEFGLQSAMEMARSRRGKWFDPQLVDTLLTLKGETDFWTQLRSVDLVAELSQWEPEDAVLMADEGGVDRVAEAFAKVVDAKSPWTYQHSTRVAEIAVGIAHQLGCEADVQRDIRRAALLHDIGKLGVSNLILDKPGKPTEEEFQQIRRHPEYSERILKQVAAFDQLADVAGGHHERLDGRGYHRGLAGEEIHFFTRILTVADICEAMSAQRPYRDAMDWEQIWRILSQDAGHGLDPTCVEALEVWHGRHDLGGRLDDQLRAVDRALSEL